ncbi:MAG TPA: FAD-dependent oxidoreductase [Chthonomonadaceae bacterium]|nr:FAD-dependent oxidoreductase [Chthonomonadaceae bacterium]
MERETTGTAVLGFGIAGAWTAYELARHGEPVTVIDRSDGVASSLTNQKWKHSGLLYSRRDLAAKMWSAYTGMLPIERGHLQRVGARFLSTGEQTLQERDSEWSEWGIPYKPIGAASVPAHSPLGRPACSGGFLTPDSVMDFPALLADLRRECAEYGARLLMPATIRGLVRDGDRVTGVIYSAGGEEKLLCSRHCIVAMGAWTGQLLQEIGIALPVRNWKSHVLTVRGELVSHITAWLDDTRLTLVPYKQTTLIADTRRVLVEDGSDRSPDHDAVAALKADLFTCFPALPPKDLEIIGVHGCIKTEVCTASSRNQDMAVFDEAFLGVRGLTAIFPGKGSLGYALAQDAAARVIWANAWQEGGNAIARSFPVRAGHFSAQEYPVPVGLQQEQGMASPVPQ